MAAKDYPRTWRPASKASEGPKGNAPMKKKPSVAKTSADRLENIKRTQVRAGKSKGTVAQRARQNSMVKDGDIRMGKGGKSYNVWDSKTQTWKRGETKTSSRSSSYPVPSYKTAGAGSEGPKSSRATSASRRGSEGPKRSMAKRVGVGVEGPKVSRARAYPGSEGPKRSMARTRVGTEGPKRSVAKRMGAGAEGPKRSVKSRMKYGNR
jgi:hypothetical protein